MKLRNEMTTAEFHSRKEKAMEMHEQGHPIEEIARTVGLTVPALEGLFGNYDEGKMEGMAEVFRICAAFERKIPHETIAGQNGMELSEVEEFYEKYMATKDEVE